jgi:CheY-like chemotaxis protein
MDLGGCINSVGCLRKRLDGTSLDCGGSGAKAWTLDWTLMHPDNAEMDPERFVILVAEDEWLVRMALADSLRDAGHAVLEVGTGAHAVELLRGDGRIDLLVTDIRMPGALDGVAVLEAAHAIRPGLPVLVTSGNLEPLSHVRSGVVAGLAKPYRLADVLQLVSECLMRPREPPGHHRSACWPNPRAARQLV